MDTLRSTAVPAAAAGVAGVAGSFAVVGFTPAFVGSTLSDAVALVTPGVVVTFAITVLGDLGKQLTVAGGVALAAALFGSLAAFALAVGRALGSRAAAPVVGAASVFGVATLVTAAPLASLGAAAAAGAALAVHAGLSGGATEPVDSGARRRVLGTLAAGLAAVGIGYPLGTLRGPAAPSDGEVTGEARALLDDAAAKSLPVGGLEPLVSDEFYRVDIAAAPPAIDPEEWSLSVTGAVESEVDVGYDDLTAMPSSEVFSTLRCVGEPLNGRKMDTALWTAVPLADLLERAGAGENCCVMLRAADDYYEEFPLAALESGMLAYRMNGRPLPRGHGAPVRALIPGHWGEINVKWLTEIEVLSEPAEGYWENRGWHGTGPVNTVAKLHAVERDDGRITVAGHAYAGTRGVSAVEVSTDGGATWTGATLSEPLVGSDGAPAADAWRQWSHEYESPGERHEVVVRAREADGTLQPEDRADAFPSGPTGWVSRELRG
ncbi:molybdopterin-dependent oxidoreductase [Halosegnis marinus]|uniref:Molybdopterin-dependent oxidoreductase n=1 Tax=Halosegnis marinus TaxID=3034023 RepID=A0ABD5ZLZ5_9EURY|nr:molybdopterin-dependent oxidoreductase [Halosegnis sp. DT85]